MDRFTFTRQLGCLLIAALIPTLALAIDPPQRELSRFALKTQYLQNADEGIYEMAFDKGNNKVFAAATDRMHREANKGYLYAFNPASLNIENRLDMPYRALALYRAHPVGFAAHQHVRYHDRHADEDQR